MRMVRGFVYTLRHVSVLSRVNKWIYELGSGLGYLLASLDNKAWLLAVSFVLGFGQLFWLSHQSMCSPSGRRCHQRLREA